MKLLFWKIAKAYNMDDYDEALRELNEINPEVVSTFKFYSPKVFCGAFLDPSTHSDAITNNMVETFNGYIINAKTKNIIYMMEDIRIALMQRIVSKRNEMQRTTSLICLRIPSNFRERENQSCKL